jgi:chromosome segregation ATPase
MAKRRNDVKYEDVVKVCEELYSVNVPLKEISVRRVMAQTGGSATTVGPMINTWKDEVRNRSDEISFSPNILHAIKREIAEKEGIIKERFQSKIEDLLKTNEELNSLLEEREEEFEEAENETLQANENYLQEKAKSTNLEAVVKVLERKNIELQEKNSWLDTQLAVNNERTRQESQIGERLELRITEIEKEKLQFLQDSAF